MSLEEILKRYKPVTINEYKHRDFVPLIVFVEDIGYQEGQIKRDYNVYRDASGEYLIETIIINNKMYFVANIKGDNLQQLLLILDENINLKEELENEN